MKITAAALRQADGDFQFAEERHTRTLGLSCIADLCRAIIRASRAGMGLTKGDSRPQGR